MNRQTHVIVNHLKPFEKGETTMTRTLTLAIALAAGTMIASSANAALYIWDGAVSSNWSTSDANWDIDGGASDVAWSNATVGDPLTWHDAQITTDSTVNLDEAIYANGLVLSIVDTNQPRLDANDAAGGDAIHFGAGGFNITSNNGGGRVQLETPVYLEADQSWSQSNVWDVRAYGETLYFQGNILTLGAGKWAWRNFQIDGGSESHLILEADAVVEWDQNSTRTVTTLIVDNTPMPAGSYLSDDYEWLGGSNVTLNVEQLVPEPASLALLGLGGLCLIRRRK
jgi:hypothetical protein